MSPSSAYYDWIREEAQLINADGCSGVTNLNGICCLVHDLEFYYAKSAADAYRRFRGGDLTPWRFAASVSYEDANKHFRSCCFRDSILGHLNPLGWWRYWGVRTKKGRAAWDGHRKRELESVGV